MERVLARIAKEGDPNNVNAMVFEMKTAARLMDSGENVIKFSMSPFHSIDVLTDKSVYEQENKPKRILAKNQKLGKI